MRCQILYQWFHDFCDAMSRDAWQSDLWFQSMSLTFDTFEGAHLRVTRTRDWCWCCEDSWRGSPSSPPIWRRRAVFFGSRDQFRKMDWSTLILSLSPELQLYLSFCKLSFLVFLSYHFLVLVPTSFPWFVPLDISSQQTCPVLVLTIPPEIPEKISTVKCICLSLLSHSPSLVGL